MPGVTGLLGICVFLAVSLGTAGLLVLVSLRFNADLRRSVARLRELKAPDDGGQGGAGVAGLALAALPKVGSLLLPREGQRQARLLARLTYAGLYGSQAARLFLGVKLLLLVILPLVAGGVPYLCGLLSPAWALAAGLAAAALALVGPGVWLDHRKRQRQRSIRRALPDALDMLVLCLEGGVSLAAAIHRVTGELHIAHPLLGAEMNIVQRKIDLGLSEGEALKGFGQRCDLAEVRDLAAVLLQSERFGAGVAKALRIHADTCRQERQQRAEEMAQKAAVKILFPTLLCIFPAIFIVLLGPAAYQIAEMFSKMK